MKFFKSKIKIYTKKKFFIYFKMIFQCIEIFNIYSICNFDFIAIQKIFIFDRQNKRRPDYRFIDVSLCLYQIEISHKQLINKSNLTRIITNLSINFEVDYLEIWLVDIGV